MPPHNSAKIRHRGVILAALLCSCQYALTQPEFADIHNNNEVASLNITNLTQNQIIQMRPAILNNIVLIFPLTQIYIPSLPLRTIFFCINIISHSTLNKSAG